MNCGEPTDRENSICEQCDPTTELLPVSVDFEKGKMVFQEIPRRELSVLAAAKNLLIHIQRPQVTGSAWENHYRKELELRKELADAIRKVEEE